MTWRAGRYGVTTERTWLRQWRGVVTAPGLRGRRRIARTERVYRTQRQAEDAAKALRAAIYAGQGSPNDPNLYRAGRRHLARQARRKRRQITRWRPEVLRTRTVRTSFTYVDEDTRQTNPHARSTVRWTQESRR